MSEVPKIKKVLMILENPFPHDERVEKEIRTLMDQKYDVHLLCSDRYGQMHEEMYKGIRIFRMYQSKFWYKLSALILIFPIYLKKWYRFAKKLHLEHKYNIIHIHDLPLSKVGSKMKSRFGLKMVCDQHEYYSNWIVETAHYNTLPGRIVKKLSDWKSYEKKALSGADLVITVEEPLRQQYIEEYGLHQDKIICLPNTPNKDIFHNDNVDPEKFSRYKDNFMVLYFGGIDILRGIENMIKAIPEILKVIPDFKFVMAGKLYGGYDPMNTAKKIKVESHVDFIGWVNLEDMPSLIHRCDLGIFTPPSDRIEINKTIATKNYQFLVMNKPMIVGSATYMKLFTEEHGIGISVDETDPRSIANGIISFAGNEKKSREVEKNCKSIGSAYYWEKTSKSLISGYQQLVMKND